MQLFKKNYTKKRQSFDYEPEKSSLINNQWATLQYLPKTTKQQHHSIKQQYGPTHTRVTSILPNQTAKPSKNTRSAHNRSIDSTATHTKGVRSLPGSPVPALRQRDVASHAAGRHGRFPPCTTYFHGAHGLRLPRCGSYRRGVGARGCAGRADAGWTLDHKSFHGQRVGVTL